eukprot:jgi/Tetstr1/465431/TSEL_010115.t1
MKVIVVGAGVSGLCTAWALVKKGVEVTLLEQGPIPNPLSASGDQHRIIRRAYGGQTGYQRRIGAAYEAWDALWDDLGAKHLVDTGFLIVSQTGRDEAVDYRQGLVDGGFPVEDLSPTDAAARYPFLDVDTIHSAAFSPEGGVLLCQRVAVGLRDWLRRAGADVRETTKVSAVDTDNGRVTLATGEALVADHVVVTAGAWVLDLIPALAASLTSYRTAVAYLAPPEDLRAAWEAAPAILDVGGTVPCKADDRRVPEPGEGERIRDLFGPPFARIGDYRVTEVVTCAYTFTRDEHFFAKLSPRATIVSACSGHGYKFGAAVGRCVAQGVVSGDREAMRSWLEARD